jgi:hypothetical protein
MGYLFGGSKKTKEGLKRVAWMCWYSNEISILQFDSYYLFEK